MNSFNHYSLGSVGEWLFRHVAGIELDPEIPGYARFVLQPFIGRGLEHARATYRTMHGEIESGWTLAGARLTWTVRIPPNTTARVCIPSGPDTELMTDGVPVSRREECFAIIDSVPAGRYTFMSTLPTHS
jgi:alpha-L-rhamnosidase